MALSKLYQLKDAVEIISLWLKKEIQRELDPEFVKLLINLATLDIAEIISSAGADDYSQDVDIAPDTSSIVTTFVTATYANTTKTITKVGHGLTAGDIGKRIAVINSTTSLTKLLIAQIVSITSPDAFTISLPYGTDGAVSYAVFPSYLYNVAVDLTQYNFAGITKVYSDINKEVLAVGDVEFDNLYRFPTKQNKCYYNVRGQKMYLIKGSSVANFGNLTITYNRNPNKVVNDNDYLDIRDNYVPLVILKAKNYCMEHLGLTAPETLTNVIDQKTRDIREGILREKEVANLKNQGKVV